MGHYDVPPTYQDLLNEFKNALNRVLSGQVLPPVCMTFDISVTLALLDITHAVRQGRPVQDLVIRACGVFSSHADDVGNPSPSPSMPALPPSTRRLQPVRAQKPAV